MVEIYTEAEAERILADYQPHPDTDRVRYMPENPSLILPLVQQGWIDAAVIPASDTLKAELTKPENTVHPAEILKVSGIIKTSMDKISLPGINDFQKSRMNACMAFMRAAGYTSEKTQAFILAYHPNVDFSFEPRLHVDTTINAYTASFGAAMEFLTVSIPENSHRGSVFGCKDWEEQKQFLKDIDICDNAEEHLASFELGDLVVFGKNLIHRSSRFVCNDGDREGQGLVGYSLNPFKYCL